MLLTKLKRNFMMKRKVLISVASVLSSALALTGCGGKSSDTSGDGNSKKRGTIGATCMTTSNPFFKVIEENMRDEAAKHGYDLVYLGCENDVSKQQKQIKDSHAATSWNRGEVRKGGHHDCNHQQDGCGFRQWRQEGRRQQSKCKRKEAERRRILPAWSKARTDCPRT